MSNSLLIIVTILYAGVAIGYINNRQYGMALAFTAYAIANIGFIIESLGY